MLKLLLYLSLLLLIQDELEVEEYWLDDKQSLSDKDSRSILSLSYQGSNDCVALCDDTNQHQNYRYAGSRHPLSSDGTSNN